METSIGKHTNKIFFPLGSTIARLISSEANVKELHTIIRSYQIAFDKLARYNKTDPLAEKL
jgi:hypothetical protein